VNKQSGELMSLEISLICIRKIRGPSTIPCGTPDRTGTETEDSLSNVTHCECGVNQVSIQLYHQ